MWINVQKDHIQHTHEDKFQLISAHAHHEYIIIYTVHKPATIVNSVEQTNSVWIIYCGGLRLNKHKKSLKICNIYKTSWQQNVHLQSPIHSRIVWHIQ